MPRVFTIEDKIGQELPDIEAAKEEARRMARALLKAGEPPTATIVVTDGRRTLFEIRLSECA